MEFLDRDDLLKGNFPEKDKTFHEILFYYASKGLTDDSLAMACGISISEFRDMRRSDEAVEKTLFKARLPMITAIDNVAWDLAMGNKKQSKRTVKTLPDGSMEITEIESTLAPDTALLREMMQQFANYSGNPLLTTSEDEKYKAEQLKSLLK